MTLRSIRLHVSPIHFSNSHFFFAHDLVRKPVPTFRDHALANAPPPVFFAVPGRPSSPSRPRDKRGSGAPIGAANLMCAHRYRVRGAFRRATAAFLSPGPCFRMRDGRLVPHLIRPAFARLRPHRVQPFKADPLSRAGRLPGASRRRGYEPRPQAPHPAPPSRRP